MTTTRIDTKSRAGWLWRVLRRRGQASDPAARREALVADALRLLRHGDRAATWRPHTMRDWLT